MAQARFSEDVEAWRRFHERRCRAAVESRRRRGLTELRCKGCGAVLLVPAGGENDAP